MSAYQAIETSVLIQTQDGIAIFLAGGRRLAVKHGLDDSTFQQIWNHLSGPSFHLQFPASDIKSSELEGLLEGLHSARLIRKKSTGPIVPEWETALRPIAIRNQTLSSPLATKRAQIIIANGRLDIWKNAFAQSSLQADVIAASSFEKSTPSATTFQVIVGTWYDEQMLQRVNRQALDRSTPLLPVLLDDFGYSIGPVLCHEDGPCWNCMKQRRSASMLNSAEQHKIEMAVAEGKSAPLPSKFIEDLAAAMTVLQLGILMSEVSVSPLWGRVIENDTFNLRSQAHSVLPFPGCSICKSGAEFPSRVTRQRL